VIEIIWQFVIKEEARGHFELMYGPGGGWSKLLEGCSGYRGTALLRDTDDPRRYLAVEFWDAPDQREQELAEREADYAELDAAIAGWTESRAQVGAFRVLAEATVRPRSTKLRSQSTRKGNRRTRRP
jgi:hypothetical protein